MMESDTDTLSALRRKGKYALHLGIPLVYGLALGLVAIWSLEHYSSPLAVVLYLATIVVGLKVWVEVKYRLGLSSERSLVTTLEHGFYNLRDRIIGTVIVTSCRIDGLTEGAWIDDIDRGRCQIDTLTPTRVTVTTADGETMTIGTADDLRYEYRYGNITVIENQNTASLQPIHRVANPLLLVTVLFLVVVGLHQLVQAQIITVTGPARTILVPIFTRLTALEPIVAPLAGLGLLAVCMHIVVWYQTRTDQN